MEYKSLYASESAGTYGSFGIRIDIAAHPRLPDLQGDLLREAAYKAVELVERALVKSMIADNAEAQAAAKAERAGLLALFDQPIFVEEVPNQYDSESPYTAHRPWFRVTTRVGHILIGWRRRVINIDWTATRCTKKGFELFPTETSTVGDRYIHAWDLGKAREFIQTIMASVPIES